MTRRLLTGATGFVGGAIALELLARTDDELLAVVRGEDQETAQLRLHTELAAMARGYGRHDLVDAVNERTRAVRGDITAPDCGVSVGTLGKVDEVWHCAASLRYEEKHRAEIEAQNIGGTRNVLDLARKLSAGAFQQISTAYVAGSRQGVIEEGPATDIAVANNCYEQSKIVAESLVAAAGKDMRTRVLRPSIVVGHSETQHGINWSGMYGFARQVLLFQRTASRKLGTFLSHARVRLLAEPDIEANLVPVDLVARNAVDIGLSDSPERFFHLVNSTSPTVRDTVELIMRLTGLREPLWTTERDGFTSIDQTLDDGMDFYRSYLRNDKTFDTTHTEAVCGPSQAAMGQEELTSYLLYYLRQQRGFSENATATRVVHELAG